jgi:hypothetical protein
MKALRFALIALPGRVVRRARGLFIRLPAEHPGPSILGCPYCWPLGGGFWPWRAARKASHRQAATTIRDAQPDDRGRPTATRRPAIGVACRSRPPSATRRP